MKINITAFVIEPIVSLRNKKKLYLIILYLFFSAQTFGQTSKPFVINDVVDSIVAITDQNQFLGNCLVGSIPGDCRLIIPPFGRSNEKVPLVGVEYFVLDKSARESENLTNFSFRVINKDDGLEIGTKLITADWRKDYGKFYVALADQAKNPQKLYIEIKGSGWKYYFYIELSNKQYNRLSKLFFTPEYLKLKAERNKMDSINRVLNSINILNINGHLNYQDSVLAFAKNFRDSVNLTRKLISQYLYLNTDNKEGYSDYYYYLARCYSIVNKFKFYDAFYDSTLKKMNNSVIYSNFYDSTYYYSEKSLQLNPRNINSMYIFCLNFNKERARWTANRNIIPYSAKKDNTKYFERLNYILDKSVNFIDNVSFNDISKARAIAEIAINMYAIYAFKDDFTFNKDDYPKTKFLISFGKLFRFISKYDGFVELEINKTIINNEVMPNVIQAERYYR